ncbi:MAG: hypothetical protein ACHREM_03835, partial [Polyangiales bacterium]
STAETGTDHGAPSTTYPAWTIDAPTIIKNGGSTFDAAKIVTVTWPSDPNTAQYQAFGQYIGGTNYWHAINSEYGIGPTTSIATPVVATPAGAALTDKNVQDLITANAGKTTGWPAPDGSTLYVFYVPQGPTFDDGSGGGDLCPQGVGGYHYDFMDGAVDVPYGIILNCTGYTIDDVLISASHEINEAVTDPYVTANAYGYSGFDANHLEWEIEDQFQDELGDACEARSDGFYKTAETNFAYEVQRQWSNAASLAGHDPCVPAAAFPWFGGTFFVAQKDTIHLDLSSLGGDKATATQGFKAAVGAPRTFQIGFFSDAALTDPMQLSYTIDSQFYDPSGNALTNGAATVAIDKTTGVNGEKAYVTVTPSSFGAWGALFIRFTVKATGAADPHDLPILLSAN